MNENHTLSARYSYYRSNRQDAGIGRFSLPEVGYDTVSESHRLRLSETAVLSETTINETRLSFRRSESRNLGDIAVPTLNVLEAFRGGGSQVGRTLNRRDSWELQNYTTRTQKAHTVKFGVRLRAVDIDNFSPRNFGGAFTFAGGFGPQLDAFDRPVLDVTGQPATVQLTSLDRYRRTLLFQEQGLNGARIRELGGGATQFLIAGGNPAVAVRQMEPGRLRTRRLAPDAQLQHQCRPALRDPDEYQQLGEPGSAPGFRLVARRRQGAQYGRPRGLRDFLYPRRALLYARRASLRRRAPTPIYRARPRFFSAGSLD